MGKSTISSSTTRGRRPDDAHTTGAGDQGRWSTKRIAMYALFVALAMAVSFLEFPLMPAAPWLKYDPSGIVCLVAGFAYGPSAAAIVSVLGFLPHIFTNPWGSIMAIGVALALSVPAALIYRRHTSRKGALAGIVVGALFDKLGRKKTMLFANLLTIVAAGITLVAVLSHSLPVCILGLCLTGFSYGAGPTITSAFTSAFYGTKYFPVNFSVMNFNLMFASFMATAASGLLESTGGYVGPFVFLLGLAVVSLLLNLSIKRP